MQANMYTSVGASIMGANFLPAVAWALSSGVNKYLEAQAGRLKEYCADNIACIVTQNPMEIIRSVKEIASEYIESEARLAAASYNVLSSTILGRALEKKCLLIFIILRIFDCIECLRQHILSR